jgi:hypothetical protein
MVVHQTMSSCHLLHYSRLYYEAGSMEFLVNWVKDDKWAYCSIGTNVASSLCSDSYADRTGLDCFKNSDPGTVVIEFFGQCIPVLICESDRGDRLLLDHQPSLVRHLPLRPPSPALQPRPPRLCQPIAIPQLSGLMMLNVWEAVSVLCELWCDCRRSEGTLDSLWIGCWRSVC